MCTVSEQYIPEYVVRYANIYCDIELSSTFDIDLNKAIVTTSKLPVKYLLTVTFNI